MPLVSFTLPVTVKITQAAVKNLHIHFNDKMVSPEVVKEIDPLDLILSDVEIGPKIAGTLDLNILTGDTEKVKVTAGFSLDKVLDVDGSFALSGVAMENYRSYLAPYLGDNITLENLDTSLDFKVGLSGDNLDVKVANGSISLDKFSLSRAREKRRLWSSLNNWLSPRSPATLQAGRQGWGLWPCIKPMSGSTGINPALWIFLPPLSKP